MNKADFSFPSSLNTKYMAPIAAHVVFITIIIINITMHETLVEN